MHRDCHRSWHPKFCHRKNYINRADRRLSNEAFLDEIAFIYAALITSLIKTKQPLILIDWNNADNKERHMILRASLALEGQPLTLLQDVKSMDDYNCQHVHAAFLLRLKAQFPEDCPPVIVTDAGFKVPWLKQIHKMGWHYITRARVLHVVVSEANEAKANEANTEAYKIWLILII